MKFLPYILKHLRRNWLRTLSTLAAMAVCIFLFCVLQTVLGAVQWGLKAAGDTRLVTRHAVSLVFPVPLAYEERIRALPGVKSVAASSWFGGSLPAKKESQAKDDSGQPDWSNFFPNMAIEAEPYLAMYPEFRIPDDQKQAFLHDRAGCVVGRALAEKFGWKVGDVFHLESFIPPYRKKDGPFQFTVRAIYDPDPAKPATDQNVMLFHKEYLEESTGLKTTGTYVVEVQDPGQAGAVAKAIDDGFENSDVQTHTETEAAFRAGFIAMAGNLALLLNTIGMAVIFTILLVTANTMSMAVRERRMEIAVLKTLGFPSLLVMLLILAEAATLGLLGGAAGVALSSVAVKGLINMPGIGDAIRQYPHVGLEPRTVALGFGMALVIGIGAGIVPAFLAYRSKITDMLRAA
jgi:putative ABC transport system permease protein